VESAHNIKLVSLGCLVKVKRLHALEKNRVIRPYLYEENMCPRIGKDQKWQRRRDGNYRHFLTEI
jgi:hypothetical protein